MTTNDLKEAVTRTNLEGIQILIVDDSDDLREILEFVLKAKGALVDSARDGAEAISKAQVSNYDLILMDMRMPGLDGRDTAVKIKSRPSKIKIVALTGDLHVDKTHTAESPFDAYITKPIDPINLSNSIIKAINS